MNESIKKLLASLGITVAEDVTEDKAIELIVAKAKPPEPAKVVAAKAILEALDLQEGATEEDVKGKVLALKHPGNVVSMDEHQKLQAKLKQKDTEDAVDGAIRDGKLTPAEKEWATKMAEESLATFKSFIVNRPKVVPLREKLPEGKKEDEASKIDDVQADINRQLGVTQEVFLKYNS